MNNAVVSCDIGVTPILKGENLRFPNNIWFVRLHYKIGVTPIPQLHDCQKDMSMWCDLIFKMISFFAVGSWIWNCEMGRNVELWLVIYVFVIVLVCECDVVHRFYAFIHCVLLWPRNTCGLHHADAWTCQSQSPQSCLWLSVTLTVSHVLRVSCPTTSHSQLLLTAYEFSINAKASQNKFVHWSHRLRYNEQTIRVQHTQRTKAAIIIFKMRIT